MAPGRNISANKYMEELIRAEFIREFGENDSLQDYVVKIIADSYNNLVRKAGGGAYENLEKKDIWGLWVANKYRYQSFISHAIGKVMKLYDFSGERSIIMDCLAGEVDTSQIDADLKEHGYHVLSEKLTGEKCCKIRGSAGDKIFKPFDSERKMPGSAFLGRNVVTDGSTTYWISDQDDVLSMPEIHELATDPFFLQIAQNYLGCNPVLCQTNMWYSCAAPATRPGSERTQLFHQDYDDINFLKIFVYLTDVDKDSGPHSYISGSLNNIVVPSGYAPSTRLTDEFAGRVYGDKIKIFTGEVGTIIIENTNGFHRGMPVVKGNRMVLQLQYSSTLLPFQQGCHFSNLEKTDFMKKYATCFLKLK